jgi:hypothetical protein
VPLTLFLHDANFGVELLQLGQPVVCAGEQLLCYLSPQLVAPRDRTGCRGQGLLPTHRLALAQSLDQPEDICKLELWVQLARSLTLLD